MRTAAADAGARGASIGTPRPRPRTRRSRRSCSTPAGSRLQQQLHEVWAFFHPTIRRVRRSGRVIVLGTPPEDCAAPRQATAQRALEGFVRSVGKEVRRGATAQLMYVGRKARGADRVDAALLLSPKSAYVSGQVVRIGASVLSARRDRLGASAGRQARAGHRRLARDRRGDRQGARARRRARRSGSTCRPWSASSTRRSAGSAGRRSCSTSPTTTPRREIATHLLEDHGGVDVVVHNAG